MDFSEIGVKSRKTGLKARENVRRDEHNMEDLDDFFREEQTTLVNETSNTNTKPPNGRINSLLQMMMTFYDLQLQTIE